MFPKIPDFLFVPYMRHAGNAKIIVNPKHQVYWQVFEFETLNQRDYFAVENEQVMARAGSIAFSLHQKYPYFLACFKAKARTQDEIDLVVKLGNAASDWYADQWILEQNRNKGQKSADFRAYYIGQNVQNWPGQECIIKLSDPRVFIRYNVGQAYFASFEQFYQNIAVIEWLDGEKPSDPNERDAILTDCWNFLAIEERLLEEDINKYNNEDE